MIQYTTAQSDDDLRGILELQAKNLTRSLSAVEISSQGFVTVEHSFESLKKLNKTERHIIAKQDNRVVGYILSMTPEARDDIPVLVPMFRIFDETPYQGKMISDHRFIVVGQVCVDRDFRGQGLFDNCYRAYREYHKDKYAFAITEIARANPRSLNAHKRTGFRELRSYRDENDTDWIVVIWNWD